MQVKSIHEEVLPLFVGQTTKFKLPSGRTIKIRETNGEDDATISSINDSSDGSATYNFLASIILHDDSIMKKPGIEDIKQWPMNDKYATLFKQRLFVHGDKLKFKGTCTECGNSEDYVEDLSLMDTDFSQEVDNLKRSNNSIPVYPQGNKMEVFLTTSSGKNFKYKILTGEGEYKALELTDQNKNTILLLRELQIKNKEEWVKLFHFAGLGSKELNEIRKNVRENDPTFDPMVTFQCKNPKCKKDYAVSLFQISSFFFPEE